MEARTRPREQKNIFEKFGQHGGRSFATFRERVCSNTIEFFLLSNALATFSMDGYHFGEKKKKKNFSHGGQKNFILKMNIFMNCDLKNQLIVNFSLVFMN